ncbi:hypothetical protein CP532_4067 [Ophiocordyceps camponoti-leonardi (nom. inval.)]|nr:hypothetical protein CP532_4067 [Ophiocordyceps camponoti-leonardi (nom. inval.)]
MLINYTLAATLVVGVSALGHNHHRHRHHARKMDVPAANISPREVKIAHTVFINGTTGEKVSDEDAHECLRLGQCYKAGEHTEVTTTTATVSAQSSEPQLPPQDETPPLENSSVEPERILSRPARSAPSTSDSVPPEDSRPAPVSAGVSDENTDSKMSNEISDQNPNDTSKDDPVKDRPEDTPPEHTSDDISHTEPPVVGKSGSRLLGLKCSEFPSAKHKTVPLNWLSKTAPWSSLQNVGTGWNANMPRIEVDGACSACQPGCMCAYACEPGWAETQWPPTHGTKNESIGGLFCNSNGMLELTNPDYGTLCRRSVGNVAIQNRMDHVVSTCRTAYPGDESMVVPAIAEPRSLTELWTPLDTEYISPQGGRTSAHYYVNKPGIGREKACVWASDEKSPIVIGANVDANTQLIFLGIAPNKKTNATLDYNVFISGNITGTKCMYIDGNFYEHNGDSKSPPCPEGCTIKPDGCVTTIKQGGNGTFVYTLEKELIES